MLSVLHPSDFESRHLGINAAQASEMLGVIGVDSLDTLIDQTVPPHIRYAQPLALPAALTEAEYLQLMRQIAAKNTVMRTYIGQGYYGTLTPSVILRNVFENPGWYTQYTPYQAEIAQGRLEALLNFQTMVCDLTAMPIANASLLDEATAAAEAMSLFFNQKNKGKVTANRFLVSQGVFPQTLDVLYARAQPLDIEVIVTDNFEIDDTVFGVLLQYPDNNGEAHDYRALAERVHAGGAYLAVAADILSLALLTPPGEWGADVVVGNTQRFGVPMGYGGPHAAYFATREDFKRHLPGRIIGVSIDTHGNRALRMALQTREQHIRREKATSNICTAQALLANMAGFYAVYHGAAGIKAIAERVHGLTVTLAACLRDGGFEVVNEQFFDTITVATNRDTTIAKAALANGINFRYANNRVHIALDETTTVQDVADILACFAISLSANDILAKANTLQTAINPALQRTSEYLTHPVFNTHHSESLMMRYLKTLENKDLSLVHSMISLGSCTMKLNAASEMIPVSWAAFANMHPFAPKAQAAGYYQIFEELEQYLCEITGFTACSLQPNSGAQGEYAGLLAIRNYHLHHGNPQRTIVLIPSSAHGTNPASAVMAGMQVVVTKCDESGNIDVADLREKAELHRDNLAALMVTYPSTHGVFETAIQDICALIHHNGG